VVAAIGAQTVQQQVTKGNEPRVQGKAGSQGQKTNEQGHVLRYPFQVMRQRPARPINARAKKQEKEGPKRPIREGLAWG